MTASGFGLVANINDFVILNATKNGEALYEVNLKNKKGSYKK